MITIQIQIRSVFGTEKAYPMNDTAHCLARIAGTTTLTKHALMQALGMGCSIVELDRYGQVSRAFSQGDISRRMVA